MKWQGRLAHGFGNDRARCPLVHGRDARATPKATQLTSLSVAPDVARARKFHEGLLNLTLTTQFEHEGKHWIEYDVGPATLAISNLSGELWKPSASGPSVALEVADFDAAIGALREAGAIFLIEPMDSGVCPMAIVSDPDGNSLAIHQRHAR